ncbi:YoaK family protein [Mucilaginibacter sp. L3T2-6]|uniref:YoaK family protein n=1 Tax=Mucilaginibacter sp. L3T2-6 TaxID=3062491 RepID=UPI002676D3A5|nr:YoaK family protein [Mucilaginibacter sp. L3T2-6]MDO3644962.1 YoaK family protein [Mucilaginibacter sp. L3T2-6]MDV6217412.1 YoaK family protein [Mucilaginibacter sp. L3T2-6]
MLRHQGNKRTFRHNVKLASLLGVTAGFVNAAGFLAFAVLTTNVTGHAALFAERLAVKDWANAAIVALWMLLFLAGAVTSSLLVSVIGRNHRYAYVAPLLMELMILLILASGGNEYHGGLLQKAFFAGSLLFGMGMQNALVSLVSGSVVRTTHLTGTFTDLGIEIAQLFRREETERAVLKPRIRLRLVIIFCFMGGALLGGYLFRLLRYRAFIIPAAVVAYALVYDILRVRVKRYYRRHVQH